MVGTDCTDDLLEETMTSATTATTTATGYRAGTWTTALDARGARS